MLDSKEFRELAQTLEHAVHVLSARGWTPATSSNFSARLRGHPGFFAVSRSGIHKEAFSSRDVMVVDASGTAVAPSGAQPSAETRLHTMLYEDRRVGAVLHTHSVNSTVLSLRYEKQGYIEFSGYEILKGLEGHETHEVTERLPIFANSQKMEQLANRARGYLRTRSGTHGFLLAGHGLYSWGQDILAAKRHIEVFEFLFECRMREED